MQIDGWLLYDFRGSNPIARSVIGFDDVPEAGYYLPPLTTARQDFGVLGRQALSTLVDRMSGAIPAGRRVRVAPELIVRASAAGVVG